MKKLNQYLKTSTNESACGRHRISCSLQIGLFAILHAGYTWFSVSRTVPAIVEIIYEFMLLSGECTHTSLVILRRLRCRSVFSARYHYRQRAIALIVIYWYCCRSIKFIKPNGSILLTKITFAIKYII